jgi:hypothetical protein
VIVLTAFGNIEGALDTIQKGAFDYLAKPFDVDAIVRVVRRALEQRRLVEENKSLRARVKQQELVGRSAAISRSTSRWRAPRRPTCRCSSPARREPGRSRWRGASTSARPGAPDASSRWTAGPSPSH